jgi:hypothetical protein
MMWSATRPSWRPFLLLSSDSKYVFLSFVFVGKQKVFDFGNGPNEHNVWFGVEGNTANAMFQLHLADGSTETLIARNVLVQGEWAHWHVGIDDHHVMYIEKNDVRVAAGTAPLAVLHSSTFRRQMLIGESHWTDDHHPLHGVVLGLRVDLHDSS